MFALLLTFTQTGNGALMLVCALLSGVIIGAELSALYWAGSMIFLIIVCGFPGAISAKGAAMAAFLVPSGAGGLAAFLSAAFNGLGGLAIFLMAVTVSGYAVWEMCRTERFMEEKRDRAYRRQ
jgi:hypothetical protein